MVLFFISKTLLLSSKKTTDGKMNSDRVSASSFSIEEKQWGIPLLLENVVLRHQEDNDRPLDELVEKFITYSNNVPPSPLTCTILWRIFLDLHSIEKFQSIQPSLRLKFDRIADILVQNFPSLLQNNIKNHEQKVISDIVTIRCKDTEVKLSLVYLQMKCPGFRDYYHRHLKHYIDEQQQSDCSGVVLHAFKRYVYHEPIGHLSLIEWADLYVMAKECQDEYLQEICMGSIKNNIESNENLEECATMISNGKLDDVAKLKLEFKILRSFFLKEKYSFTIQNFQAFLHPDSLPLIYEKGIIPDLIRKHCPGIRISFQNLSEMKIALSFFELQPKEIRQSIHQIVLTHAIPAQEIWKEQKDDLLSFFNHCPSLTLVRFEMNNHSLEDFIEYLNDLSLADFEEVTVEWSTTAVHFYPEIIAAYPKNLRFTADTLTLSFDGEIDIKSMEKMLGSALIRPDYKLDDNSQKCFSRYLSQLALPEKKRGYDFNYTLRQLRDTLNQIKIVKTQNLALEDAKEFNISKSENQPWHIDPSLLPKAHRLYLEGEEEFLIELISRIVYNKTTNLPLDFYQKLWGMLQDIYALTNKRKIPDSLIEHSNEMGLMLVKTCPNLISNLEKNGHIADGELVISLTLLQMRVPGSRTSLLDYMQKSINEGQKFYSFDHSHVSLSVMQAYKAWLYDQPMDSLTPIEWCELYMLGNEHQCREIKEICESAIEKWISETLNENNKEKVSTYITLIDGSFDQASKAKLEMAILLQYFKGSQEIEHFPDADSINERIFITPIGLHLIWEKGEINDLLRKYCWGILFNLPSKKEEKNIEGLLSFFGLQDEKYRKQFKMLMLNTPSSLAGETVRVLKTFIQKCPDLSRFRLKDSKYSHIEALEQLGIESHKFFVDCRFTGFEDLQKYIYDSTCIAYKNAKHVKIAPSNKPITIQFENHAYFNDKVSFLGSSKVTTNFVLSHDTFILLHKYQVIAQSSRRDKRILNDLDQQLRKIILYPQKK
jgi:hypothetical protein